eukprot:4404097-Prymnesium_polylepis.1
MGVPEDGTRLPLVSDGLCDSEGCATLAPGCLNALRGLSTARLTHEDDCGSSTVLGAGGWGGGTV